MIFSKVDPKFIIVRAILFLLCVPGVLCVEIYSQDFRTVANGVDYVEVTRTIDNSPVRMHLLRLDLTKVRLDVVHALDAAIGLEKTSSIAKTHGAFAAINGGFFRMDDSVWAGDPAGVFEVDGKLLSESDRGRVALAIKNMPRKTLTSISPVETGQVWLIGFKAADLEKPFISYRVSGLNRELKEDEVVIFSPQIWQKVRSKKGDLVFSVVRHIVTDIYQGGGDSTIPTDGLVILVNGKSVDALRKISVGDRLNYSLHDIVPHFRHPRPNGSGNEKVFYYEDMVGGVPQLIKNGRIDITWEQEKTTKTFVETKHPRTAVAKLKDGKFLMITVDGRSESSGGISLTDLAAYLLELGATDAMNLDGGGSSTMFLDGKVVNHASDKDGERKVSDAILVTLRPERKTVPKGDKH